MMKQPFNWAKIVTPKDDFDLSLIGGSKKTVAETDIAISKYLTSLLHSLKLKSRIIVGPEFIEIEWLPNESVGDPLESAIALLREGKYNEAIFLLRAVLETNSDNVDALYNLGMALSDLGETEEAISLLSRLTVISPDFTNAFVALGVAYGRAKNLDGAEKALAHAVSLEPKNPFASRNLAGIYLKQGKANLAVPLLEKSIQNNSGDPAAWYGLGQAKVDIEDIDGADTAFRKVIEIAGPSDIGEAARRELTKIAESQLRKRGLRGERPDALMYCLSALEKFSKLTDDELKPILFEIAMAGNNGFDINNPDKRHSFKSIAGDFSGLQAVCYMYVAGQRILPGQDMGIDLSKEYSQALGLFGK